MGLGAEMKVLGERAQAAARALARSSGQQRIDALESMAQALRSNVDQILEANAQDLEAAEARGLDSAMVDRLKLDAGRVESMAQGLSEVAAFPDPLGEVLMERVRPNGIRVGQVRIPLGVVGIIYEARPNVTADAAGLCIKSGNVVFLRGGSEAAQSNQAILSVLRSAVAAAGLPEDTLMSLPTTDRHWIGEMLKADAYLDVIIPRGGESLIRYVAENSRVPVIKHYKGVCHVYVDGDADLNKAEEICFNAKVHRPGVCNAMETMLVSESVAPTFLPAMAERFEQAGVVLRGCEASRRYAENIQPATDDDYHAEFLALILAIRVVKDINEAIDHIETYGSDHTECIVSENYTTVQQFLEEVNSSVVIANASTRFSDGGQMGLGAEIGISTTKLHAYGPMGVTDLTTRKYVIRGTGQVRS